MILWHIILILFAHTVADFIWQTDAQAKGKSTSNKILADHVTTYTSVLGVMLIPLFSNVYQYLAFLGINFVLHFGTDWVTSRLTSYYWKQEKRHEFFVTIGFDQFVHMTCLLITYVALLV